MKDLPTYKILYERNTNGIENYLCPRCQKIEEDWDYIWICKDNEHNIREIIEDALVTFEQKLEKDNRIQDKIYNIDYLKILYGKSLILTGKSREWELFKRHI